MEIEQVVNVLACNYTYVTVFIDTCVDIHIHISHFILFLNFITLWVRLWLYFIDEETEAGW